MKSFKSYSDNKKCVAIKDKGLSTVAIVLIVLGCLILIASIIVGVCICKAKRSCCFVAKEGYQREVN